jgi:hypothetical protein
MRQKHAPRKDPLLSEVGIPAPEARIDHYRTSSPAACANAS